MRDDEKTGCSVLLLTYNEEVNIGPCLSCLSWCDDVVVVDSFSTDRSVEMARESGARVFQREWDNFAGQRNWALDNVEFRHPWVFHLDADERFTGPLRQEVAGVVAKDEHSGYMVPSKVMFRSRWLRRSALYPSYQMRLGKVGEIRFVQVGHGQREADAARGIGMLREPYIHEVFARGTLNWFLKHRGRAAAEAREIVSGGGASGFDWRGLVAHGDPVRRRRAAKFLAMRAPFRPVLRFLYMYLLRGGFMDGRPGLEYCLMMAEYEKMITRKLALARKRNGGG